MTPTRPLHLLRAAPLALLLALLPALALAQQPEANPTDNDKPPADQRKGIEIDVRAGARRVLTSVAVPDTLTLGGAPATTASQVQQTLREDLDLAGYFSLIAPAQLFFDPSKEGMDADKIDYKNWANVKAQGLIKSAVVKRGDELLLDLHLYAVDSQKRIPIKGFAAPVPVGKDVNKQVHAFVNEVVRYYTGKPGQLGAQVVFVKRNSAGLKQIYAMSLGSQQIWPITRNSAINLLPSVDKQGRIYYTSYLHQNPDLWVYENGKHHKLSAQRGQNSGAARCGDKLALTLSMGGENTDIYLIDPKTGQIKQRLTNHWAIDTSPTFSPDCSKIAFVSGRSSSPHIYVMDADGSNQRRLTYQGTYNTTPVWSPKGDVIAFTARDERNRFDVFTVNLEGNIERLTQNQGNNEDPSFSPDGRYIVYTSTRGGKGRRIWLMTSDGQHQRVLTKKGSEYSAPVWSP